jgi:hypothetical protein
MQKKEKNKKKPMMEQKQRGKTITKKRKKDISVECALRRSFVVTTENSSSETYTKQAGEV